MAWQGTYGGGGTLRSSGGSITVGLLIQRRKFVVFNKFHVRNSAGDGMHLATEN